MLLMYSELLEVYVIVYCMFQKFIDDYKDNFEFYKFF